MGVLYQSGNGVAKNEAAAVEWFTRAAEKGYHKAQYNLGIMYENGRGVPADNAKAIGWFRKAAAQGNTDAQKRLRVLRAAS